MKKLFSIVGVVATAVFAFSSCNREQAVNDNPVKEKVTFTFTAEKPGEETRTAAVEGETGVSYLWTDEDLNNMRLYLVTEGPDGEQATVIPADDLTFDISSDNKQMSITAKVDAADSYTFRAVLAGAFSNSGNPKVKATQSPKVDNFDPTADLLVSDDLTVTSPTNMLLKFIRKVVVNKMTLKGLTAGEKVKKVIISSNQYLNGTWINGQFSYNQPAEKTITLTYPNLEIGSNGQFPVYFTSIPNTGHELTINVITDAKNYTKTLERSIAFNQGSFTRFGVTMPEGTVINNIEGVYYIAAKPANDNWFLMDYNCTSQSIGWYIGISTNVNASAANVEGDDFVGVNDYQNYYWDVKAVKGGYTIQNLKTNLYLACTDANSNYASYKQTVDNTAIFSISVEDKQATIQSVENSERYLRYNSSGSSNRFAFYLNTQNPVYLIPVYNDGLTAVTLSFTEATINTNTNASETGQTVTANPNVSAITDAITYTLTGDEIGTINASTGAVTLNGSAGTATVTATFQGDATYREATASYQIIVTPVLGVMYKIVSSLNDVTEGTYVIVNDGYYLPNAPATSSGPVKNSNTKATIDGDYVINVSDDMTWDFSGTTSAMTIKSTISGNYYLVVSGNGNSNLRVNTTSGRTWTIAGYSGTSGAFTLKDNTNSRYCASYSTDWRSYNTYNASNYSDGGRIYLFKKEDNRLESGLAWSAASASATIDDGDVITFTAPTLTVGHATGITYNSTDTDVATISDAGVVTIVGGGTTTIQAIFAGNTNYKPATAEYELTVTDNRTPVVNYDFETIAELNSLATALGNGTTNSDPVEYDGKLTGAIVSFVPNTSNAIIKDDTGSILIFKNTHGLLQGQTFSGDITVSVKRYYTTVEITALNASFSGSQAEVLPATMTLSQLEGNFSTYQNAYVKVEGLTVTARDGKNISVSDGSKTYLVYDNDNTSTAAVGDVITAIGTVADHNGTNQIKVWASSDITITTPAPKAITFSQPASGGSITVSVGGNTITSGTTVASGTIVTLTATAATDYSFDSWTVTGATVADASATTTTFTMGTSAVSVSASFTSTSGQTQDYTTVWTASSGALGSEIGSGTINTTVSGSSTTQSWSYTRTLSSGSSYTGWTSNCIQLGKTGGVENLEIKTSNIPGTIKSVSVECSSYQGKHKVSISVGGTTYLASTATETWTKVSAKSGTGSSSGEIIIRFTEGTRALYIKSITVVYNN